MKKHYVEIDLLRCYALLNVVILHAYIACKDNLGFSFSKTWQFVLKTPAWAGVWIFMIISGFLAEERLQNITEKRRPGKEILLYYADKIVKILIPTYIFISIIYILVFPKMPSLKILIEFFTLMFRGIGAEIGIGATWFVFTLMWLYLLAPFFSYFINYIMNRSLNPKYSIYELFFCVFLLGLMYRSFGDYFGFDWYRWLYVSPIANIDLFFGGMLINKIRYIDFEKSSIPNLMKWILLLIVTLACSLTYYYGELNFVKLTNIVMLFLYKIIFPSIYLIIIFIILNSNDEDTKQLEKIFKYSSNVAGYTFQFYLWHSIIQHNIASVIPLRGFLGYFLVVIISLIVTAYISILFTVLEKGLMKRYYQLTRCNLKKILKCD